MCSCIMIFLSDVMKLKEYAGTSRTSNAKSSLSSGEPKFNQGLNSGSKEKQQWLIKLLEGKNQVDQVKY